jgi:hypothetical protein
MQIAPERHSKCIDQIARPNISENAKHFSPVLLHVRTRTQASKREEKHMIRTNVWMNLITSVLLTAVTAFPQSSDRLPVTDAEKIASAMQAGPKFVTQNATVLDWPSSPGGEFRVLRAGTNGWTCLPGRPGAAHEEPGCFDQVFLQFMKDSMAGHTPNVQSVGISYMYGGFWVPNKSHAMGSGNEFHVGPHIMIIGLDQKILQTLNHDGSNGKPYVNHLPGHSELYLVIPIREWEDSQAVSTLGATR